MPVKLFKVHRHDGDALQVGLCWSEAFLGSVSESLRRVLLAVMNDCCIPCLPALAAAVCLYHYLISARFIAAYPTRGRQRLVRTATRLAILFVQIFARAHCAFWS